jgi:hypothetical protein
LPPDGHHRRWPCPSTDAGRLAGSSATPARERRGRITGDAGGEGDSGKLSELKPIDIERIDTCLMSFMSEQFKKVAFVIGQAMLELDREYPALPDMFTPPASSISPRPGSLRRPAILTAYVSARFVYPRIALRNNSTRRRGRLRSTIHSILAPTSCPFVPFVVSPGF